MPDSHLSIPRLIPFLLLNCPSFQKHECPKMCSQGRKWGQYPISVTTVTDVFLAWPYTLWDLLSSSAESLTYCKSLTLSSESSQDTTLDYEYICITSADFWGYYCSQNQGLPSTALKSTLWVPSLTRKLPVTATELIGNSKPQEHLGSWWAYHVKCFCCHLELACWCHCCAFDISRLL